MEIYRFILEARNIATGSLLMNVYVKQFLDNIKCDDSNRKFILDFYFKFVSK